ncbi:MAG: RimK/LysX family protein [Pseudomonadota bacterium]
MSSQKSSKTILGWREWATLSDCADSCVKAKIDTGAKTSALDAQGMRVVDHAGHECVEFFLPARAGQNDEPLYGVAPLAGRRTVRSSNGEEEERFLVTMKVVLGRAPLFIDVTLADRSAMVFAMLIGRDVLAGRFLVDPQASFLLGSGEAPGANDAR